MKTAIATETVKISSGEVVYGNGEDTRLPVLDHPTWTPGDCCHQGDLILVCIEPPKALTRRKNRQLADGDTKGSRHVVVGGEVFDSNENEMVKHIAKVTNGRVSISDPKYIGPLFAGPCVVEHPEHQHHSFPADTLTCVVFQRNVDSEERERRAID